MDPPDYYREYGDVYARRFDSLDETDLSPEGLKWSDDTMFALQTAIEHKRAEDPAAFAELERNPEKFKEFAYATHPDAYIDSGLFDLPAQDIAVIGVTPDLSDVLTAEGISQMKVTLGKIDVDDVADILKATVEKTLEDGHTSTGFFPDLAKFREAERIVDRFQHHTDWSKFPPEISFPHLPIR